MASITWEKDGQTEALQFVENSTNGYFLDAHGVVIAPLLTTLDADASNLIIAAAAKAKKLRLPVGTHRSSKVTGNLFNMAAAYDGLEIYGDGIGRTIIQFEDALTLTGDTNVFALLGWNQAVHDLSIYNGSSMSGGAFDAWSGVVASGAFHPHIYNVEVAGVYAGASATAGGFGINLYQSWNTAKYTTTLGTNIASGTRTVTPGSMQGIYVGQRLSISSPSEEVIVTAVPSATTFTAVFASAHDSSDTVSVPSRGDQYALVENCTVRDSYSATAYGVSSNSNVLKDCKAISGGATIGQHALYMQGGHNKIIGFYAEGWYGYHFHQHAQVPNIDSSGNVYTDCESVNPGTSHGIIDSLPSDGTNPDIPNTIEDGRYATFKGCTFRKTNQTAAPASYLSFGTPGLVEACVFEDAWLQFAAAAPDSIAKGNHFRALNGTSGAKILCQGLNQVVEGNTFRDLYSSVICITLAGTYSKAINNTIYSALGAGIQMGAHDIVSGNTITVAAVGGHCLEAGAASTRIFGNVLSNTHGDSVWGGDTTAAGVFYNNEIVSGYLRYDNTAANLIIGAGNVGQISNGGGGALTLTGEEGALAKYASSAGTQPVSGYGVILNAGLAERAGTGSTVLVGVSINEVQASGYPTFVACQAGSIVSVIMDAAWTIGNVVLPSTGTAGKWSDSGATTQPTYRKSYGILLNSGGGAGTARMLIAQMG